MTNNIKESKILSKIINNGNIEKKTKIKFIKMLIKNIKIDYKRIKKIMDYIFNLKNSVGNTYEKKINITIVSKKNKMDFFAMKNNLKQKILEDQSNLNFLYNKKIINGIIIDHNFRLIDCSIYCRIRKIRNMLKQEI
jgi:F0F1-type ATP synthase delta subunit